MQDIPNSFQSDINNRVDVYLVVLVPLVKSVDSISLLEMLFRLKTVLLVADELYAFAYERVKVTWVLILSVSA